MTPMPHRTLPHRWRGPAAALLVGCGHVEQKAGTEVVVRLADEALPAEILEAQLSVSSVELLPCAVAAAPLDWLVPVARAHHPSTSATGLHPEAPLQLGAPGAVVGSIHPPAADYCAVRVVLEPMGEEGTTLSLRREGDSAPTAQSNAAAWLDLPLSPSLALDAEHLQAELGLSVGAPRWGEALTAAEASGLTDPNELGDAIFAEVRGTVSLSLR